MVQSHYAAFLNMYCLMDGKMSHLLSLKTKTKERERKLAKNIPLFNVYNVSMSVDIILFTKCHYNSFPYIWGGAETKDGMGNISTQQTQFYGSAAPHIYWVKFSRKQANRLA